ncbi:MAG: hypothetical protein HY873_11705 [Chloroflexi bacterium]|nr:hypothetical protein [Chloroflexota bacterium]
MPRATELLVPAIAFVAAVACAGCSSPSTPAPTSVPSVQPRASATPTPPVSVTPAATPTVTQRTPAADPHDPVGLPLDPDSVTDRVTGPVGLRVVSSGAGATVRETSERLHISDDQEKANAGGWDCRVHVEYEGRPAVDWYVAPGLPVNATMDGDATLVLNTVANAFDYHGVPREPYLGSPDRARAPVSPFPGPGGGMGLYVSITNGRYRIDLGHLSLDATIANLPATAFAPGYSHATDYASLFAIPRGIAEGDIIATWPVRRGDVVGFTGDTGYSEAPHLHYAITRIADAAPLCPTRESRFEDNGWLLRGW